MPVIIFEGSKLAKEQKEQLIKEFVAAASRITNIPEQSFVTLIKENDFENIGKGGDTLANLRKG